MGYFPRVALALLLTAAVARAETVLQLYVEGSTYDPATESWTKTFAPGETIRLWAIGNVDGGRARGRIDDVHLLFAYPDPGADAVSFTLTPTTTGGLGGFTDPSVAAPAVYVRTVTDGSLPTLPNGSSLPPHGEYGPGTHWQEYALGDFRLTDSPLGDFIRSFPAPNRCDAGQISVYDILITGTSSVHFDLFGSVRKKHGGRDVFAAFSHDAVASDPPLDPAPEPGTFALCGVLAFFGAMWLRRRRVTSARAR